MTGGGVLVLAGPPCAGKSTVGKVLAADSARNRTIYVEVDALFSLLLPGSDRNQDDRMLAYDAAHGLARTVVEHGRTVILDEELVREWVENFPYSDLALRLVSSAASPEDLAIHITTWLGRRPAPVDRTQWAEAGRGWA